MSFFHSEFVSKSGAAAATAVLGLALFSGLPFLAQENPSSTPPAETLKVTTGVVDVFAVVKDHHGHLVPDLTKDDFELTENNDPQQIRYFSRETDTPLTMGILVDTSPSQGRVLPREQVEAKAFVRQVIRPKDMAFVLHFDVDVELLQDFTSDKSRLEHAIDETTIGGGGGGPLPGPFPTSFECDIRRKPACRELGSGPQLPSADAVQLEPGHRAPVAIEHTNARRICRLSRQPSERDIGF